MSQVIYGGTEPDLNADDEAALDAAWAEIHKQNVHTAIRMKPAPVIHEDPYHDEKGRFATGPGSVMAKPGVDIADAEARIERAKAKAGGLFGKMPGKIVSDPYKDLPHIEITAGDGVTAESVLSITDGKPFITPPHIGEFDDPKFRVLMVDLEDRAAAGDLRARAIVKASDDYRAGFESADKDRAEEGARAKFRTEVGSRLDAAEDATKLRYALGDIGIGNPRLKDTPFAKPDYRESYNLLNDVDREKADLMRINAMVSFEAHPDSDYSLNKMDIAHDWVVYGDKNDGKVAVSGHAAETYGGDADILARSDKELSELPPLPTTTPKPEAKFIKEVEKKQDEKWLIADEKTRLKRQEESLDFLKSHIPDANCFRWTHFHNLKLAAQDGRFKSQFETGNSDGLLDPEVRAKYEKKAFSYPKEMDPRARPIYGYVSNKEFGEEPHAYGELSVKLKPTVRERTTVTIGDSLVGKQVPAPMNKPDLSMIQDVENIASGYSRPERALSFDYNSYWEAQYHGGIRTSDIDSVCISKNAFGENKERLKKLCDTMGWGYHEADLDA